MSSAQSRVSCARVCVPAAQAAGCIPAAGCLAWAAGMWAEGQADQAGACSRRELDSGAPWSGKRHPSGGLALRLVPGSTG